MIISEDILLTILSIKRMTDFIEVYNTIDKNVSANGTGNITGKKLHDTFYDVVKSFESYYNESKHLVDLANKDNLLTFGGIYDYDKLPIPEYTGQVIFVQGNVYMCTEKTKDTSGWTKISDTNVYTPICITIPKNVVNDTYIQLVDLGLNKSDIDNILDGRVGYTNIKDLRNNYFGNCNIVLNKDLDYIRISYFSDIVHSYILKKKNNEWKIFVE